MERKRRELHAAAPAAMPFLSLRCKVYLINSLINVSAPVPLHVPLPLPQPPFSACAYACAHAYVPVYVCMYVCVCEGGVSECVCFVLALLARSTCK